MTQTRERAVLFLQGSAAAHSRLLNWLQEDGFEPEWVSSSAELKEALEGGDVQLAIAEPLRSVRELSGILRAAQRGLVPLIFGSFESNTALQPELRPWPCAWLSNGEDVARGIARAYATRDALARRISARQLSGTHELGLLAGSVRPALELIPDLVALCGDALGAQQASLLWSPWAEHRLREGLEAELPRPQPPLARLALLSMVDARSRYVVEQDARQPVERFAVPLFGAREVQAVLCVERRSGAPLGRGASTLLLAAADQIAHQLERARMADALEHRERLATLGELLASVVHELNSPLSYVRANLEALHQLLSNTGTLPEATRDDAVSALDESITGMHRMSELISGIRIGARAPKNAAEPVELAWVARRAAEVVRGVGGQRTLNVSKELGAAPPVMADAGRLLQIAQNLLVNAAQAAGPGGRIVLRTGSAEGQAFLEVVDDGPGVPEELEERIFEPFFTTKASETGTGLGLSICRRIAREHGGELVYRRAPGGGACFRLSLPVEGAGSSQSTSDA